MFILNRSQEDIGPISFGGFNFTIPANGVYAIQDDAGAHITTKLFRIESRDPNAKAIPDLLSANEKDWDGKSYAQVSRFKIDYTRIPERNDLINLAEKYGMKKELLDKFRNEPIDNEIIVNAINKLPVPEEIRFPERRENNDNK